MTADVNKQMAKGAIWMIMFKLIGRSIGLVSTMILARLLVPADFGLVAMAMSIVAMTQLMSSFGFDIALIQLRNVTREHYDTAWTYNVLLGFATALILLALTWPAAAFYHEPRLIQLIPVFAFTSIVQGFENIGTVAFRKEMNFRREFRFLLGKKLFSFVVTMILAFTFRSYWALAGGQMAGILFGVASSYALHPYRPRFSLAAGKDLFHFSKWLLANNVLMFVQNQSTDFILGRTVGAHGLGIYNISFEIATLPSTELIGPLNRAALPGYAKIAHDFTKLKESFLGIIGMIALFIFPVGVGLASVADPAVRLMLGDKWLEAIPLIQIISVYGIISALQSNIGQVYFALGKPRVITLMMAASLLLMFPILLYVTVHYGPIGAASVFLVFSLFTTPIVHVIFFRIVGMRVSEYLVFIWRPIVSSIVMGGIIFLFRYFVISAHAAMPVSIELAFCIAIGAISYCSSMFLLWIMGGKPLGAEATVLTMARVRIANLFMKLFPHKFKGRDE